MGDGEERQERESVWSVARGWMPWYLLIVSVTSIGWVALVASVEAAKPHPSVAETAITVVERSAPGMPMIVLFGIILVAFLDGLRGVFMVTAWYLRKKLIEPAEERLRDEGRDEGRELERAAWQSWNERRMDAARKGEAFDEPPPGV